MERFATEAKNDLNHSIQTTIKGSACSLSPGHPVSLQSGWFVLTRGLSLRLRGLRLTLAHRQFRRITQRRRLPRSNERADLTSGWQDADTRRWPRFVSSIGWRYLRQADGRLGLYNQKPRLVETECCPEPSMCPEERIIGMRATRGIIWQDTTATATALHGCFCKASILSRRSIMLHILRTTN